MYTYICIYIYIYISKRRCPHQLLGQAGVLGQPHGLRGRPRRNIYIFVYYKMFNIYINILNCCHVHMLI